MLSFEKPLSVRTSDDSWILASSIFYSDDLVYIIGNYDFFEGIKIELSFKLDGQVVECIHDYGPNETTNERSSHYIIPNSTGRRSKTLTIIFQGNEYVVELTDAYYIQREDDKKQICMSTLFKSDYYLLPAYISYYFSLGCSSFRLYYNGKIDKYLQLDDVSSFLEMLPKEIQIEFVEWDYPYWTSKNGPFRSGAQIQSLNDAYLRSKYRFDYIYFNDLDEYLSLPCSKFENLFLCNKDIDVFQFANKWSFFDAETSCPYKNFVASMIQDPLEAVLRFTAIDKDSKSNAKWNRSKCLLRTGLDLFMGVHVVHTTFKRKNIGSSDDQVQDLRTPINLLRIEDGFWHISNLAEKMRKV